MLNNDMHLDLDKPSSLIKNIKDLREKGLFDEAEKTLESYRAINNTIPEVEIIYAENLMAKNKFLAAIQIWKRLLNLNIPGTPKEVQLRLADALFKAFNFEEANDLLDAYLKTEPENKLALELKLLISETLNTTFNLVSNKLVKDADFNFDQTTQAIPYSNLKDFTLSGLVMINQGQNAFVELVSKNGEHTKLPSNIKRTDVFQEFNKFDKKINEDCGFKLSLNLKDVKEFRIFIDNEMKVEIFFDLIENLKVLIGKEDWLFLDNDSNKSVDLFTGKLLLSENVLKDWKHYAESVKYFPGLLKTKFLIAPNKETVFFDYYPYQRGKITLTDQILDLFKVSKIDICFPHEALRKNVNSYSKTDTHWSDFGSSLALESLGFDILSKLEFKDVHFAGDLGSKIYPNKKSYFKSVSNPEPDHSKLVFDNFIVNTANVSIYENANPIEDKKIVIFGCSFGMHILEVLKYIFARVVYVYSPATPIYSIINYENPDYILLQTNERFLTVAPHIFNDVSETNISKKISAMESDVLKNLISKLSTWQTEKSVNFYYETYNEIFNSHLRLKDKK